MTYDDAKKRKLRILDVELRDVNRFKPNPLGPGFLSRRERYTELYLQLYRLVGEHVAVSRDEMLAAHTVGTVH